jgi:hypothetical protein
MYATTTIPAQTLTPEVIKALSVTGRTVTVETHPGGPRFQARVNTIEGVTWTTVANKDGSVTLDSQCTPLVTHADPQVQVEYVNSWGEPTVAWSRLSRVTLGVCLAKW